MVMARHGTHECLSTLSVLAECVVFNVLEHADGEHQGPVPIGRY